MIRGMPQALRILHRRSLSVKAKTSRAARLGVVGAGLDSQSPSALLVAKGGIPTKPAGAGFGYYGRRVRFPGKYSG